MYPYFWFVQKWWIPQVMHILTGEIDVPKGIGLVQTCSAHVTDRRFVSQMGSIIKNGDRSGNVQKIDERRA